MRFLQPKVLFLLTLLASEEKLLNYFFVDRVDYLSPHHSDLFWTYLSRRAERAIIDLLEKEKVNPTLLTYINRLSDFLFVAARFENRKEGDILWIPEEKG